MKTTTKKMMALAAITSAILLTGCQKDLYDPNYVASKDAPISGIPSDFKWSTISSVNLTVNVDDQYNGKYYYLVEVYDNNPLYSSDAKLLAKGVAKNGQAYTSLVSVPQDVTTLYVCQTNPIGCKEVKAITISAENATCNFGSSASTKSVAVSTRAIAYRTASYTYPTYTTVPSNAVEIKDNSTVTWAGGVFVVRGNYVGEINFPGGGNTTIYVEGKWTNTASAIQLQSNTNIIVLNGGEFATKNSITITGSGNPTIVVMPGAKFNTNESKNIDIDFNTDGEIINQGTFVMRNLSLPSKGSFHNNGTISMAKLTINSSTNAVVNDNLMSASEMSLTNGTLVNNDVMTVSGKITANGTTIQNNGNLTANELSTSGHANIINNCKLSLATKFTAYDSNLSLASNSLMQSKDMEAGIINVELKGLSIFNISNSATFKGAGTFKGLGSEFALVKLDKVSFTKDNQVHFTDYVKVEIDDNSDGSKNASLYYFIEGLASMSKVGESGLTIPASNCNGNGYTPKSGTPSAPTFPIAVKTNSYYTYLMEDLWPNYGDYDMNDLVATISPSYTVNELNKVKTLTINVNLRAVGAAKQLAAALQLDNVLAKNVSNVTYTPNSTNGSVFVIDNTTKVESGQTQAVIPLFDNAQSYLGSTGITNTVEGGNKVPAKSVSIDITFKDNTVTPSDIAINKLNFFIVTDKQKTNRTEVHLAGYNATDKVNKSLFGTGVDNSNGNTKYLSKNNLVWGMMIPTIFNFPLENTDITKAYPYFYEWAASGGTTNTDWYNNANSQYIFK